MGAFSIWHWLIVLVVVLVLFGGGGKISRMMGDFGKGMKAFKKGIKDGDEEVADSGSNPNKSIESDQAEKDEAAKS